MQFETLIGENILVCGTTPFIKNPNEKGFVSYHQDAKYIGLEPHQLGDSMGCNHRFKRTHNGCMRMWSGSHKE